VVTPQGAGESYQLPFEGETALNGTQTDVSVPTDTVIETLEANSYPVIYNGEFHWSGDLAAKLDADF